MTDALIPALIGALVTGLILGYYLWRADARRRSAEADRDDAYAARDEALVHLDRANAVNEGDRQIIADYRNLLAAERARTDIADQEAARFRTAFTRLTLHQAHAELMAPEEPVGVAKVFALGERRGGAVVELDVKRGRA
jgi:hypothetical protein